jgi:probable FeS assembly SUF system protein SufT
MATYQKEQITLSRDVEAAVVPAGTVVTLKQGEPACVTQALGDSYTVVVNGNMFRIEGKNADALGLALAAKPAAAAAPATPEDLEKLAWEALRTCYDPEIPVNIVDLGLIYDCGVTRLGEASYRLKVKMTLTAPGCGMGPMLAQDVQDKLLAISGVDEAEVELVWDPPWNRDMMSETARLELGIL